VLFVPCPLFDTDDSAVSKLIHVFSLAVRRCWRLAIKLFDHRQAQSIQRIRSLVIFPALVIA
jgi:hypothetical protein